MLFKVFLRNPALESIGQQDREQNGLLEQAADQVKEFVEVGAQEPDSIGESVEKDEASDASSDQDMKHMVVLLSELRRNEIVNVHHLEPDGYEDIQQEELEVHAASLRVRWLEMDLDALPERQPLILVVNIA